jgi:hypothetical protein
VLAVAMCWAPISTLYVAMALVFWYALAASIHALYTTTGTARTRARFFALAFGFRDICWNATCKVATQLMDPTGIQPYPASHRRAYSAE